MKIRSALMIAALCVSAPTALAQISLAEIETRLTADGYKVVEIERDSRTIEVKAFNKAGACTELHLDPDTGKILRTEGDDDCGSPGSGRHGGRSSDDHGRHGNNHN